MLFVKNPKRQPLQELTWWPPRVRAETNDSVHTQISVRGGEARPKASRDESGGGADETPPSKRVHHSLDGWQGVG